MNEVISLPAESDQQFDIGSTPDSLDRMRTIHAQLGDTYRVYAPGRRSHTWVFNHPRDIRRVLIANHRNYAKGVGFDRIRMLLGNGIIVSEGDFWKRQRRMMQPTFHRRVIATMSRTLASANDVLLAEWNRKCVDGEPVDVTADMSNLALTIILRLIFGDDLDAMTAEAGGNPFAMLMDNPSRDLRFAMQFHKASAIIGEWVARRRASGGAPAGDTPDYVSMLLAARDKGSGEGMDDAQIVAEINTLIVAGHETTASALTWVWYLLGEHPREEARLHAEIDANPEVAEPTLQAMEAMRWTNYIIREALRLYPPGWILSRRTIAPDTLGGHEVPAGTDVMVSPWFVHRHPDFWPDAESFRPERWEGDNDGRPRLAYMPFSAGPHHCIGETLALFEMQVHLHRMARHFRLRRTSDTPIGFEALINLRPATPLIMRLERRRPGN